MNNGMFRKKRYDFSMISNELITDKTLSLRAKGLYVLIQYYIMIPGFTLYKDMLERECKEGESTFKSAWRELKKSGYLVQYKFKGTGGKFYYEYELLDFKER